MNVQYLLHTEDLHVVEVVEWNNEDTEMMVGDIIYNNGLCFLIIDISRVLNLDMKKITFLVKVQQLSVDPHQGEIKRYL